jgi:hypothetical protein
LPAEVMTSFDAMVEAEAVFKADLEKLQDQALLRRYGRRSEISSPSQPCEDLSKDSF